MRNLIRGVLLTAARFPARLDRGKGSGRCFCNCSGCSDNGAQWSTVSYNGQEFLSSFNSARSEARLVLVFSPT